MNQIFAFLLSIHLASNLYSASIVSHIGSIDLADYPGYPVLTSGLPSYWHQGPYWKYAGSIRIDSDPGEDIYDIRLSFSKNPGQFVVKHELGLPWGATSGQMWFPLPIGDRPLGMLATNEMPFPQTVEYWEFGWSTDYFNNSYSIYGTLVELYGTAEIWIDSSYGSYVLDTYQVRYWGLVPETSFMGLMAFSSCPFIFWRKRHVSHCLRKVS